MSTKTSIKRVALVAAAALTIGGFSAVSAHAATTTAALPFYLSVADSGQQTTATATAAGTSVAGPYNYFKLAADSGSTLGASTTVGVAVSGAGATVSVFAQPSSGADTLTVNGTATGVTSSHSATVLNGAVLKINTPTAGTVTVTVSKNVDNGGSVTTTTLQTFTITVNAASVVGAFSAANSFSNIIGRVDTVPAYFAAAETSVLTASTTDSSTPIAKGATGSTALVSVVAARLLDTQANGGVAIAGATIVATTTKGLVAGTGSLADTVTATQWAQTAAPVASSTTDATGWALFAVYSSGQSGVGTIALTYTDANGVVNSLPSKTITFYSSTIASLKATVNYAYLPLAPVTGYTYAGYTDVSNASTHATQAVGGEAVAVTALDLNGNPVGGSSTIDVASSNTAVATVASNATYDAVNSYYYPVITPVTVGSTTLTFTDDATGLIVAKATINIVKAVISSIVGSTDASSYDPGTKVKFLITAKDSAGNPVADGTYAQVFTSGKAPVTNVAVQGTVQGESITTTAGVATSSFYAPLQSGNVLITNGVLGTSTTLFVTALQAVSGVGQTFADVTFAVNGNADASAATDAANAATDAANAAADAADNATQAASEALAAVNSLATTVASLIAGIKAQITSLTNLITKIKNKVGA